MEMTREELKEHCKKQIEYCEMWARYKGEEPHGKIYEEHKLILELLEQESKTGYWVDDEFGTKCSYCGIHTHLDKFDRPMKFKYCSMCGAKMVEPDKKLDDIIKKIAGEIAPNLVTSSIDAGNIKAGKPTASNLLEETRSELLKEKECTLFKLVETIKDINVSTCRGCGKSIRLFSNMNLIDNNSYKKICSFDIYESNLMLDAFSGSHVFAYHLRADGGIDAYITDKIVAVTVHVAPDYRGAGFGMTREEINNLKYKVCCPVCDNDKCVKGTDSCEAEAWARDKAESEV